MERTVRELATTERFVDLSLSVDEDKLLPNFFISVLVKFSFLFVGIGNK
jgi:hypothetical protein